RSQARVEAYDVRASHLLRKSATEGGEHVLAQEPLRHSRTRGFQLRAHVPLEPALCKLLNARRAALLIAICRRVLAVFDRAEHSQRSLAGRIHGDCRVAPE